MTTPTGTISVSDLNSERGSPSGTVLDLEGISIRSLAKIMTSGSTIAFSDLRGKTGFVGRYHNSSYNNTAPGAATLQIATVTGENVTWSYVRTGSVIGSATVANNGSNGFITFVLTTSTATRTSSWAVTALTSSSVTYNFTITLTAEGN